MGTRKPDRYEPEYTDPPGGDEGGGTPTTPTGDALQDEKSRLEKEWESLNKELARASAEYDRAEKAAEDAKTLSQKQPALAAMARAGERATVAKGRLERIKAELTNVNSLLRSRATSGATEEKQARQRTESWEREDKQRTEQWAREDAQRAESQARSDATRGDSQAQRDLANRMRQIELDVTTGRLTLDTAKERWSQELAAYRAAWERPQEAASLAVSGLNQAYGNVRAALPLMGDERMAKALVSTLRNWNQYGANVGDFDLPVVRYSPVEDVKAYLPPAGGVQEAWRQAMATPAPTPTVGQGQQPWQRGMAMGATPAGDYVPPARFATPEPAPQPAPQPAPAAPVAAAPAPQAQAAQPVQEWPAVQPGEQPEDYVQRLRQMGLMQ